MPWLTPDSIPEGDDCRPLSIPASSDWLALVSGALTELTKPYNWQQFGALTVDETVAKMQEIVDAYYSSPCAACITPGGYRVTRINENGTLDELDTDGNWQPATDEYHIPPPEPREDGTEADQICLAAKNAVNVLAALYENLTDSWNENLDAAEAGTAFILGATALVGFEFAPITWSIVAFLTPVFAALYSALEFIGADIWDENVSNQIVCFLVECADNDAGVVTFGWDCFMNKLNSLVDTFALTDEQLRLYLQIAYMLYFMGGADALNLAGRTTAISDDDCSFCEPDTCSEDSDFTDGGQHDWNILAGRATPTVGVGLVAVWNGSYEELEIYKSCDGDTLNAVYIGFDFPHEVSISVYIFDSTISTLLYTLFGSATFPAGSGILPIEHLAVTFDAGQQLLIDFTSGNNDGAAITSIETVYS